MYTSCPVARAWSNAFCNAARLSVFPSPTAPKSVIEIVTELSMVEVRQDQRDLESGYR
jgi:hypothetical protein